MEIGIVATDRRLIGRIVDAGVELRGAEGIARRQGQFAIIHSPARAAEQMRDAARLDPDAARIDAYHAALRRRAQTLPVFEVDAREQSQMFVLLATLVAMVDAAPAAKMGSGA